MRGGRCLPVVHPRGKDIPHAAVSQWGRHVGSVQQVQVIGQPNRGRKWMICHEHEMEAAVERMGARARGILAAQWRVVHAWPGTRAAAEFETGCEVPSRDVLHMGERCALHRDLCVSQTRTLDKKPSRTCGDADPSC